MQLVPEIGVAQLAKKGEELCGDAVEISRTSESTIIVLSDGLGSGVKANILSTLTTKIAAHMMCQNVPVNEVVETIVQTLPTCKVRGLAYSTFTIIKVNRMGEVHLFEYDSPPILKLSKGKAELISTSTKRIFGKKIGEAYFKLAENEILVIVSDGVTQAGLGEILPLGLGIDGLVHNLENNIDITGNAQEIANQLIEMCETFYAQEPGDDTSVVTLRLRKAKDAVVFTGPPKDSSRDSEIVEKFMNTANVKIVCGGTTAKIVAREINKPLKVNLSYIDPEVPPIAEMEGVDLITEGILTLSKGLELLERNCSKFDSLDGASLLVKELLECDKITFMVGTQINPAHQNPELPLPLRMRKSIVERWKEQLIARGKIVEIYWF
ncbi:MAG: hypothetical protein PWQ67_271 [Clostridia bacterium]|jgi:hypothetical protein|nr:hypothetical protein [Clostridia bacterium]MDN5321817.1 hypothetical protein [Clostridia bacterium]